MDNTVNLSVQGNTDLNDLTVENTSISALPYNTDNIHADCLKCTQNKSVHFIFNRYSFEYTVIVIKRETDYCLITDNFSIYTGMDIKTIVDYINNIVNSYYKNPVNDVIYNSNFIYNLSDISFIRHMVISNRWTDNIKYPTPDIS